MDKIQIIKLGDADSLAQMSELRFERMKTEYLKCADEAENILLEFERCFYNNETILTEGQFKNRRGRIRSYIRWVREEIIWIEDLRLNSK